MNEYVNMKVGVVCDRWRMKDEDDEERQIVEFSAQVWEWMKKKKEMWNKSSRVLKKRSLWNLLWGSVV